LVSPSSGSVGVSLPAVLSWQPVEGALSYRVQLTAVGGSGAVVFDGDVPGTSAEVGGLSAGAVYEWRVRALNAAGQGPWSEPWGFTAAPPPVVVPAAAILIAPQNQAAEVPLISSLTWAAVDGADTYRIQLWKDGEDATKLLDVEGITDLSYAVSLPDHEAGYSWRVRAANVAGHGPWSDSWHFTTVSAPVAIPESPNLIAPQNQAAEVPLISSLTWAAVDGADTYRIQLWKDGEDANKLLDEEGITNLSYAVSLPDHDAGDSWRVRAANVAGHGPWSDIWHFTTDAAPLVIPEVPALVAPHSSAEEPSLNPVLNWQDVSNADRYHVQLWITGEFEMLIDQDDVAGSSLLVPGLENGQSYSWRVRAGNESGYSEWSSAWNFNVQIQEGLESDWNDPKNSSLQNARTSVADQHLENSQTIMVGADERPRLGINDREQAVKLYPNSAEDYITI